MPLKLALKSGRVFFFFSYTFRKQNLLSFCKRALSERHVRVWACVCLRQRVTAESLFGMSKQASCLLFLIRGPGHKLHLRWIQTDEEGVRTGDSSRVQVQQSRKYLHKASNMGTVIVYQRWKRIEQANNVEGKDTSFYVSVRRRECTQTFRPTFIEVNKVV